MRMFAMFTLVTFVPLISCMNTTEGFRSVKEQEQVVVPLLSEVKSISCQITGTSQIMIRYKEALQKTRKMISKANELTEPASYGGPEIGDDSDDVEMLHCSTVNSLRKMIELNETLQIRADAELKLYLEQGLAELKASLK